MAFLFLALLMLGVPAALALLIGWPLPHSVPAISDVRAILSGPLEWSLVIDGLALIAWGAWAHFAVCVVAELAAVVRARRLGEDRQPIRVPLGGFSQELARRLVEAAVVTATIATSLTAFSGTVLTPARPAVAAQGRRRPERQSIALPSTPLARAEGQLRVLAEPDDLSFVDEALRALTLAVSGNDAAPPDVQFAHLREDHLDLALSDPRSDPPPPFMPVDDGLTWRASAQTRPLVSREEASQVLPLLPLLLNVGRDAAGPVLLDMEALGSLAVEGPERDVLAVLAHLVAEAVLAPWTDGVEVLLVGFDTDLAGSLEELAPDRVTAVDDIDPPLLRALTTRVSRVAAAGGRLATRIHVSGAHAQEEVRPPLLVVVAALPPLALAEQLAALVPGEGRGAVALIAPEPWSGAKATWTLGSPLPVRGKAPTPVPCRLEPDRVRSLAETLRTARQSEPQRGPEGDVPGQGAAPLQGPSGEEPRSGAPPSIRPVALPLVSEARKDDDGRRVGDEATGGRDQLDDAVEAYLHCTAPATVSLMGPVVIHATGNIEPDRRLRLTEIVAYLATPERGGRGRL